MSTYEISKSSLLSLKAEILRKQQELGKVKAQNDVKIRNIKKNSPLDLKNKGINQRQEKDISEEDENLLKKSRTVLEAKSKLYEKLSKGTTYFTEEEIEYNRRYLVQFNKKGYKRQNNLPPNDNDDYDIDRYPDDDEINLSQEYEPAKSYDEEWVEYVDCLGRTRTCLRKDLEYLKSKDKDLESNIGAKDRIADKSNKSRESSPEIHKNQTTDLNISEENELLSNDMRTEMLRRQWEKEEEELMNKTNIHYQDVLFNEARSHGVGYYGFSKDEEERAKQQEALKNLRQETKEQQKKSQDLKVLREKQLAARIKAAKNRKRARMGLPPEEDESETTSVKTTEEQEKVVIEEDKKKKENDEKEKLLENARKSHIRPWDIGKRDMKKHYEYSQEEWVDKKRKERPGEFAPPTAARRDFRGSEKNVNVSDTSKSLRFSTKKCYEDNNSYNIDKSNRKYEESQRTPIINECVDNNDDSQDSHFTSKKNSSSRDNVRNKGVEIAPPPTFDYYGPEGSKKLKTTHEQSNIGDSIEAGLKYLREQIERKQSVNRDTTDMFIN